MKYKINNLVLSGGGVLGIAFLGVLNYLYDYGILQNIKRIAGTSAGAITACITSFSLPFYSTKKIANTLDFKKIPQENEYIKNINIPNSYIEDFEDVFGDMNSLYRLIKNYGWYSSEYLYEWVKKQIALQFDETKKLPPYTFSDFKNADYHKNKRPFLDLYIIGTDISTKNSKVFSYESTPNMEVAEAVRISMSIPLYFEPVKIQEKINNNSLTNFYSDGGIMRGYPIELFDSPYYNDKMINGVNVQTLGAKFINNTKYTVINSFVDFVKNLMESFLKVQEDIFNNNPKDKSRTIEINTGNISSTDFNISAYDSKYNFLYRQGYYAAKKYFYKSK